MVTYDTNKQQLGDSTMFSSDKRPVVNTAYKKYSMTPNWLAHLLINKWHIAEENRDCLQEYYILHWSPNYFRDQLVEGTIIHGGKKYLVVYHRCTPTQLKEAAGCTEVKLSFREAVSAYQLPAYVLVSSGKQE